MRFQGIIAVVSLAAFSAGAVASAPIGTLQSEGRFEVRAADSERTARFSQDEYTFFSGDTVTAQSGPAVLNLNGGGGLGFTKGSEVTVTLADDGTVEASVENGTLLYAFPEGRRNFRFQAGNFTVTGQPQQAQALQVSSGEGYVGTIELLEDGNIKAMVRDGALFIANGESVRYQVNAGETVGLLDLPAGTIRTQGQVEAGRVPPILIQSPEQVGTNEDFLVRWQSNEPIDGDYLVIAEEGAPADEFESVVSTDEGETLEFEAPGDPGDYEIRVIDGETGAIKRFVYLDVRGGPVGAYWTNQPIVGGAITVAAGAVAVYIGADAVDDDDPEPVSP
ncbi:MAG: hypothetical protein ACNS61_03595 [Candidatus Wenzhouxiangella sp. M2_3B_020]